MEKIVLSSPQIWPLKFFKFVGGGRAERTAARETTLTGSSKVL